MVFVWVHCNTLWDVKCNLQYFHIISFNLNHMCECWVCVFNILEWYKTYINLLPHHILEVNGVSMCIPVCLWRYTLRNDSYFGVCVCVCVATDGFLLWQFLMYNSSMFGAFDSLIFHWDRWGVESDETNLKISVSHLKIRDIRFNKKVVKVSEQIFFLFLSFFSLSLNNHHFRRTSMTTMPWWPRCHLNVEKMILRSCYISKRKSTFLFILNDVLLLDSLFFEFFACAWFKSLELCCLTQSWYISLQCKSRRVVWNKKNCPKINSKWENIIQKQATALATLARDWFSFCHWVLDMVLSLSSSSLVCHPSILVGFNVTNEDNIFICCRFVCICMR